MSERLTIAESLLGCALEMPGGYAPCPGKTHHSKGDGKRDFRVVLDGAPTGYCFHTRCSEEVETFNKQLRKQIWIAEHGGQVPRDPYGAKVADAPRGEQRKRPPVDLAQAREIAAAGPAEVSEDWLTRRSPVDPRGMDSAAFLEAIFAPEERVLVFSRYYSQGDFCHWIGHGSFRLAAERGIKAVASALPKKAPEGVWYLVQPVTGQWAINGKAMAGPADRDLPAKYSRRAEGNVTAWRHFVIESDELPPDLWRRVLVQVPLPIAAVYTSGGRSIHALVRVPVDSKATWDATRDVIRQLVCPLGADPGALTAVRLSRLPGCQRGSKGEQRLLYLNPKPEGKPLFLLPEVRSL